MWEENPMWGNSVFSIIPFSFLNNGNVSRWKRELRSVKKPTQKNIFAVTGRARYWKAYILIMNIKVHGYVCHSIFLFGQLEEHTASDSWVLKLCCFLDLFQPINYYSHSLHCCWTFSNAKQRLSDCFSTFIATISFHLFLYSLKINSQRLPQDNVLSHTLTHSLYLIIRSCSESTIRCQSIPKAPTGIEPRMNFTGMNGWLKSTENGQQKCKCTHFGVNTNKAISISKESDKELFTWSHNTDSDTN